MSPDVVSLELEIGPSVIYLFGTCLLHLLHLKENIFGEDQTFTDMNASPKSSSSSGNSSASGPNNLQTTTTTVESSTASQDEDSTTAKKDFDPRVYRPLDIIVSVTMHDIQAHLMKVIYALARICICSRIKIN